MKNYSRSKFSDDEVSLNFDASLAHNYESVADMLADLGEFDARRLYLPKAFDSMHAYCVEVKQMTPDAAFKHIRVARTARRFPAVFFAVADGRLHLSAVLLLTPHLTPDTADELLAAAARKSKSEIERLLPERFPKPDVATSLRPIAPGRVAEGLALQSASAREFLPSPGTVVPSIGLNGAMQLEPLPARTRLHPLSPGKYAVEFALDKSMYEDLHAVGSYSGTCCPRET